jgi:hypothetical protein
MRMMMTIFFEVRIIECKGRRAVRVGKRGRSVCIPDCLYPRNDNQTQEMIVLFPFANLDEDGTKSRIPLFHNLSDS